MHGTGTLTQFAFVFFGMKKCCHAFLRERDMSGSDSEGMGVSRLSGIPWSASPEVHGKRCSREHSCPPEPEEGDPHDGEPARGLKGCLMDQVG